jgi:hypothetical protein
MSSEIIFAPMSTGHLVDLWCSTFTVGNYPLCKSLALELDRRSSLEPDDQHLAVSAKKFLAQSLHFLGDHEAAATVGEEALSRATIRLANSSVHPAISVNIVLARIAALAGDWRHYDELISELETRLLGEALVSTCQTMALVAIPAAFWRKDGEAAGRAISALKRASEVDQLSYWIVWANNTAVAARLAFGPTKDTDGVNFEHVDPKQADHLATLDERLICDAAIERSDTGRVGWTRPEILRAEAVAASWYDTPRALNKLASARASGTRQGVTVWLDRLAQSTAAVAERSSGPQVGVRERGAMR